MTDHICFDLQPLKKCYTAVEVLSSKEVPDKVLELRTNYNLGHGLLSFI